MQIKPCQDRAPRAMQGRWRGPSAVAAFLALASGPFWPHAAVAQTMAARILVMPFATQTEPATPAAAGSSAWISEAAALVFTEEFQALGLEAFSRDERVAVFDRLQLPLSSSLTRATMIRTGELIGASDVVVGDVRLGQRLTVRARLIRIDAARQSPDVEEQGSIADMVAVFARAANALARSAGRPLASSRPSADAGRQARMPADVFENYVKGLVAIAPATQQRFLEAAYHKEPRDGRILMALWNVYAGQGSHAKALAVARNVPADSPLLRNARFAAALSLIELGRLDEAFKALSDLHAQRSSAVLLNALGIVQLRRAGMPDGGSPASLFDRAVKAAPEDPDYLFNLGYAYALGHEAQAALFWLREAVRFDATDGDAHLVMSAVLESTGKTVEAQRELELARLLGTRRDVPIATPRESVPPRLERLRTDLDASISRRFAASIGTPARQEQQEVAAFHVAEGRRLFAAQKDRDAINELRRAIYLSPYQDEPHLLLGRLYQRGGRLPEAIDEFKVAIWCKESAATRLALGAALLESGDRPGRAAKPSARSCSSPIQRRRRGCSRRSIAERDPGRLRIPARVQLFVSQPRARIPEVHVRSKLPRDPTERKTARLSVHVRGDLDRGGLSVWSLGGPRRAVAFRAGSVGITGLHSNGYDRAGRHAAADADGAERAELRTGAAGTGRRPVEGDAAGAGVRRTAGFSTGQEVRAPAHGAQTRTSVRAGAHGAAPSRCAARRGAEDTAAARRRDEARRQRLLRSGRRVLRQRRRRERGCQASEQGLSGLCLR